MTDLFTEHKPWGYYTILDEGNGYKVKKLVVKPGSRLSLQTHLHRSEFWTIAEGNPIIVCGDIRKKYSVGDYVLIPKEAQHRLENDTDSQVTVIEIQNGSYLGEDDIIRIEDDYIR
ncbi:MAG TPA: phosphomannose isomerase type II C-terminal cupin domain [Candidatus Gastranaerophilales bacterium]|nr:phosphomannose isomerase type II C-terminal cupin domain [Candidatus Gastranaerophilales bacterium]